MSLRVAPVGHDAARYAVTHWHYSRVLPTGKLVKIGVWEDGRFVGVVIFSRGATPQLGTPYGLSQAEVCELTRVALDSHTAQVSQILAEAVRYLRVHNPGIRLIVSFADTAQGHHGGIYQAANWIYTGPGKERDYIRVRGVVYHPRSLGARYGVGGQSIPWLRAHVDPHASNVHVPPKHRYLLPLDRKMRRQILPLALPYPERAAEASRSHAPDFRSGEAGAVPVSRSTGPVTA